MRISGPQKWSRWAKNADIRIGLILTVACLLLYLPGIGWGVPDGDAEDRLRPWGPDETAPKGPVTELQSLLPNHHTGNPQYPVFHYALTFVFYIPYLLFLFVSGGIQNPGAVFPYGLANPAEAFQAMLLIARGVSVAMAVGTVLVVYALGKTVWDRATGAVAAVFVMLMYPMFYYGKMSNVDVPAVFWTSLVLLTTARTMRDGLPVWRAVWLGVFAALAIGTKDSSYGACLLLPVAIMRGHLVDLNQRNARGWAERWKAPLVGLGVSSLVYAVVSGLAIRPAKYFAHLRFIRSGVVGHTYFEYEATLGGLISLLEECFFQVRETLGLPVLLAALGGVAYCLARERRVLWLLLPILGLLVFVLLPVGFVQLRFVLFWGVVLACFAARAVVAAWRANRLLRPVAALAVAAALALGVAQAADLAHAMRSDSRYMAGEWLAERARPGDTVEVTNLRQLRFFPKLPPGVSSIKATILPGLKELRGEFILLYGADDLAEYFNCPQWFVEELLDGSAGYDKVAEFKTETLFEVHSSLSVNPQVLIFARREVAVARGLQPVAARSGGNAIEEPARRY